MSIILVKGGNVSLSKERSADNIVAGLGWITLHENCAFDLHASVFLLTETGKVRNNNDLIFYNNGKSTDESIKYLGNSPTANGDNASFHIILSQIPGGVSKLVIVAHIHDAQTRRQNFGMVHSAFIRLVNPGNQQEIVRFDLNDYTGSETAMLFGEIYRHRSEWKFRAIGQGFTDGFPSIVKNYGMTDFNFTLPPQPEDPTMTTDNIFSQLGQQAKQIKQNLEAIYHNRAASHLRPYNPTMTTDNIFDQLSQQAQQIEQNWNALYRDLVAAQSDNPHLSKDFKQFSELNDSFRKALQHLYNDLNAPTLILATTGTTSSGKSTLVNLLCGADLMPRMAQEMSAGVVYIKHSPEGRRHLKVHKTNRAKWKCGEWSDLSDKEIREKLTNIMDSFNQNRGENQPETPNIELTYPLACFSNPDELLNLSGLPQSTQFQLMDLPGLRNQGDITNAEVIQKCKDALCLVAYNMEETDENRRRELVQQVLKQVKNMGGSPARMLFVLNRIDVFRKDDGWQRRQEEHIDKVRKEIHNILHDGLPEHRDKLKDITYCPLSSLPALYALLIRAGSDRVADAGELENHFKPLINDVLGDLPRDINKWSDQDFKRISDTAWKSSYGAEFYSCLGSHIQRHFPALVIPSIVKRFVNQVQEDIGRLDRTCEAQLNSSDENFEKAQKKLAEQEAKLKEFIAEAKQQLLRPIGRLNETLKKRQKIQGNLKELNDEFEKRPESKRESLLEFIKSGGELQKSDANSVVTSYLLASDGELNYLLASDGELKELVEKIISYKKELDALSMDSVLDIFIEGLLDTEIFQSRLDENKLRPLSDWEFQLRKSATEVLDAMKQSLVNGSPSFAGTSVENLPKSLQDHLAFICKRYARDLKDFSQISDNSRKDDIQESLDMFLDGLNNIVTECLELQSQQESKRIHDAMDLLMKTYLRYLQAGIDGIAREWNLNMGESVLDGLSPPEIGPVRLQSELKSDWRDERIWWTLWLSTKRIYYKTLPDPEALHVSFHHDIVNQVGMRAEVFSRMIIDYIDQLNDKIDLKQEFVQRDFDAKLIQAHQQHRNDYQKAQQCWLPLYEQSQQVVDQLKQLNEEYL